MRTTPALASVLLLAATSAVAGTTSRSESYYERENQRYRETLSQSRYATYWLQLIDQTDEFCAKEYPQYKKKAARDPMLMMKGICPYPPEYLRTNERFSTSLNVVVTNEKHACDLFITHVCEQREDVARQQREEARKREMQEKREQEERQDAEKRAANQSDRLRAQEEAQRKREDELAQIRAGTRKPKGCVDVGESEGASFLTQALIEPSKKSYLTIGQIERYESGVLMLRLPRQRGQTSAPLFFKAITSPKTIWFDKDKLSIGQLVTITGRYVANEDVQLFSGASAPVAVFETTCVESSVRSMF